MRYLEDFNGYSSIRYPGQEKPHHTIIKPRRPSHSEITGFYSQIVICDDEEERNILQHDHFIPTDVAPNYQDLINHIHDEHELVVVQ